MKNKSNKQTERFVLLLMICLFSALFLTEIALVFAQTADQDGLEVVYPTTVPGFVPPQSVNVFLPHYIRYIYFFFIISGGLIALLALIYGGFRFLTSAGNPAALSDAKSQILAGLLGLTILLGSYIILNELNPDLVSLRVPSLTASRSGIIVYNQDNCAGLGNNASIPELVDLPANTLYKALRTTDSVVLGQNQNGENITPLSLYSFNSNEELTLELFANPNCSDQPIGTITNLTENECRAINIADVQCIRLIWYIPGVWVFNKLDNANPPDPLNLPTNWREGTDYLVFQTSQVSLPADFFDRISAIALVPDRQLNRNYGAVLHNIPGGLMIEKGWAHIYLPGGDSHNNCEMTARSPQITLCGPFNGDNRAVSSLEILNLPRSGIAVHPITVCRNDSCLPQRIGDDWHSAQITLIPGGDCNAPLENDNSLGNLCDITSTFGSAVAHYNRGEGIIYARSFHDDRWNTDEEVMLNRNSETGMHSIRISEGANYLMLLYERHFPDLSGNINAQRIDVAVTNQGVPALRTIEMQGRVGTIIVIRLAEGD